MGLGIRKKLRSEAVRGEKEEMDGRMPSPQTARLRLPQSADAKVPVSGPQSS